MKSPVSLVRLFIVALVGIGLVGPFTSSADAQTGTGELNVFVVDEVGNPVEGACLVLVSDTDGVLTGPACTDAVGTVIFGGLLVSETYTVEMESVPDGYQPSEPSTFVMEKGGVTLTLVVTTEYLAPPPVGALHIAVVDETGNPVAGADLEVANAFDPYELVFFTTDNTGELFTELPVGDYTVTIVQAPAGYLTPEPVVVTVVEGQTASLTLVVTAAPSPGYTAEGTNVTVEPSPGTTVTFDNVIQAGETTVTVNETAPKLPEGYLQVGTLFYDVETTAVFEGSATICFTYDPATTDGGSLSLLHYENGTWVDVTTSNDTVNGQICGQVTSFSPFAVVFQVWTVSGFYAPVDMTPGVVNTVKGGAVLPLKFNVYFGSTEVTDPAAVTVTITQTDCTGEGTDAVEEASLTADGTPLRYSGTPGLDGQFVQTWKTPKVSTTTCYTATATTPGGTAITASFQLKP